MKGGEGGWTNPRKLDTLAGNTSKKAKPNSFASADEAAKSSAK
jgi:hypothetical protein